MNVLAAWWKNRAVLRSHIVMGPRPHCTACTRGSPVLFNVPFPLHCHCLHVHPAGGIPSPQAALHLGIFPFKSLHLHTAGLGPRGRNVDQRPCQKGIVRLGYVLMSFSLSLQTQWWWWLPTLTWSSSDIRSLERSRSVIQPSLRVFLCTKSCQLRKRITKFEMVINVTVEGCCSEIHGAALSVLLLFPFWLDIGAAEFDNGKELHIHVSFSCAVGGKTLQRTGVERGRRGGRAPNTGITRRVHRQRGAGYCQRYDGTCVRESKTFFRVPWICAMTATSQHTTLKGANARGIDLSLLLGTKWRRFVCDRQEDQRSTR